MKITRNHFEKSEFVRNQLTPVAKVVDQDVQGLLLAIDEQAGEEYIHILYWSGYVKRVNVSADSFRMMVVDVMEALT